MPSPACGQVFIGPRFYTPCPLSHVVYGEFEYQRNSLGDEKDLNESGITPNKVI